MKYKNVYDNHRNYYNRKSNHSSLFTIEIFIYKLVKSLVICPSFVNEWGLLLLGSLQRLTSSMQPTHSFIPEYWGRPSLCRGRTTGWGQPPGNHGSCQGCTSMGIPSSRWPPSPSCSWLFAYNFLMFNNSFLLNWTSTHLILTFKNKEIGNTQFVTPHSSPSYLRLNSHHFHESNRLHPTDCLGLDRPPL